MEEFIEKNSVKASVRLDFELESSLLIYMYFKNSVETVYIKNSTVFVNTKEYLLIMLIHNQTRLIDAYEYEIARLIDAEISNL